MSVWLASEPKVVMENKMATKKAPAKLPVRAYVGDPTYVLPRKSSGPAVPCGGPKKAALNMKPSMKMPANSGQRKG